MENDKRDNQVKITNNQDEKSFKERQKELIIQIMQADEESGLYDTAFLQKNKSQSADESPTTD